jgi:chemotaxis signal transduction protein
MGSFVIVEVASETLALPLADVEEVLQMVALTTVHGSPAGVEGLLDLRGEILPVVDMRRRLALEVRPAVPDDQLLVVRDGARRLVLRVDRVIGLAEAAGEIVPGRRGALGAATRGAVHHAGGVALVPALDGLAADAALVPP